MALGVGGLVVVVEDVGVVLRDQVRNLIEGQLAEPVVFRLIGSRMASEQSDAGRDQE